VAKTHEAELALAARQAELAEGLLIRAKQIAHDYYASHIRMPPLGVPLIGRISTRHGEALVGTPFMWVGKAYVFVALAEHGLNPPLVIVRVADGKVLHMTAAVWRQIAPQIDA
jgi:hypothetical protein